MPARLLLALLALVLSSCIEGDEELWLERDGSGRLEATYRMPPTIMNRFGGAANLESRLRNAIDQEPTIHLEEIGSRIEGTQVVFILRARFEDVRDLISMPRERLRDPETPDTPSAEEAFFGEMSLRLSGLSLHYDRSIDLSPVLPESVRRNPAMLGDSTFRYTLHLPARPTRHNADSVDNDGTTLHWSFLLREYTAAPIEINSRLILPLPWWVWTAGLLVVLLLGWLLLRLLRKNRSSDTLSAVASPKGSPVAD